MKRVLLFIPLCFVLIILQSCGSLATSNSEPIVKVVPVENASKDDLYVRANNWMVGAFNNAKSVVQFTDKESGTITGKYYLSPVTAPSQYGPGSDAYALINIQVKDNASKITVTPESFQYMKGNMYTLYNEEKAQAQIEALIASFEEEIQKKESTEW
ncbi:protein of unknown function [Salinimicrobium sediminis]|uniref:DUF4468 domain-containing protein n=1 Tax=Salinimicrobium sediminis TaxID=1343891 RepID=A0A285X296_9FLAO|nr:DUF4468 domain-containing protein [Salinimicrobium sediminis]SOC78854.1 protein of unknown function [Salinimicrobium sediminis]